MVIKTSGTTRIYDDGYFDNVHYNGGWFPQNLKLAMVVYNTVWAGDHVRALQQSTGTASNGVENIVAYIPILQNGTIRFGLSAGANTNNNNAGVRLYRWRHNSGPAVYYSPYLTTTGTIYYTDQWVEYGDRFVWTVWAGGGTSAWTADARVMTDAGSRFDASAFLGWEDRNDKFAYNG